MQPFRAYRLSLLTLAVAAIPAAAHAQNVKAGTSAPSSVCVSLDSNYERIQAFLPSLAKSLKKDVPRQQKQVRVIAAGVEPGDPVEAARAKSCAYLLQLSVLETTGVGGAFNSGSFARNSPPVEESERRELQFVRIDYRLRSLNSKELDVSDTDRVRYLEYPSTWDAAAFQTAVERATTRVAVASLNNLPKN